VILFAWPSAISVDPDSW
jgi:hypothetical protein